MSESRPFLLHADETAEESFDWGTLTWLCSGKLSPGAEQTLGICRLLPGCRNPLHYHPNCEELLYLISGTGRHSYDGHTFDMRPGSTIRIPAGVRHNLENAGSEPIVCLICFSSGDRQTIFLEP